MKPSNDEELGIVFPRSADGARSSSAVGREVLAAAYRSASMFGVGPFEPATASCLMAALLVHDLRYPQGADDPGTPLAQHPLKLLADAAHHGGLWRMPFAARSALPVAAMFGALRPR